MELGHKIQMTQNAMPKCKVDKMQKGQNATDTI